MLLLKVFSDSPLHNFFDSVNGVTPAPFDDLDSFAGVMNKGHAPIMAECNTVFH